MIGPGVSKVNCKRSFRRRNDRANTLFRRKRGKVSGSLGERTAQLENPLFFRPSRPINIKFIFFTLRTLAPLFLIQPDLFALVDDQAVGRVEFFGDFHIE